MNNAMCDRPNCTKLVNPPGGKRGAKGLCSEHYEELRKRGERHEVILPKATCIIWGCGKPLERYANGKLKGRRGMCWAHYKEVQKDGGLITIWESMHGQPCKCGKPAWSRRRTGLSKPTEPLCKSCYEKARANGPDRQKHLARKAAAERARKARMKLREEHALAA